MKRKRPKSSKSDGLSKVHKGVQRPSNAARITMNQAQNRPQSTSQVFQTATAAAAVIDERGGENDIYHQVGLTTQNLLKQQVDE